MRAIMIERFGGPDVIGVSENVDRPSPGHGQVLIEVAASGINFAEVMFRRGQLPVPLPHVPGLEVTGIVRAVGPGSLGT
jgi:NADPH:quinone reductase